MTGWQMIWQYDVRLETAGVEFIDENGGGPGVRLRKAAKGKSRK